MLKHISWVFAGEAFNINSIFNIENYAIYSKIEYQNIFNLKNPYLDINPNALSPYFLYIWSP